MLIKQARVNAQRLDVRVGTVVEAIATDLAPLPDETVLWADGGELFPGLHDHHIHLFAAAAALASLDCDVGPADPETGRQRLSARLSNHPGDGWIRGVNYHEQQLGELDRHGLDELCPHRPLRVQHRSGKLWVCNTMALQELGLDGSSPADGVEVDAVGGLTGRIVRNDKLMAQRLQAAGAVESPDLLGLSRSLASMGIVSVTDTSAHNDAASAQDFQRLCQQGTLLQRVQVMGADDLETGYLKVLLDEDRLPPLDELVRRITVARGKGRNVAFHCVTHLELVFALAALELAPLPERGFDRIEHGAEVTDELALRLGDLGLPVITQPGFLLTKGDQYLQDLPAPRQRRLYRFAGLLERGVCVIASSDAPYGPLNPWQVIASAANRQTRSGQMVTPEERVEPEIALSGYLKPSDALTQTQSFARLTTIDVGMNGDLCLLSGQWQDKREGPEGITIRATWVGGSLVYDSQQAVDAVV